MGHVFWRPDGLACVLASRAKLVVAFPSGGHLNCNISLGMWAAGGLSSDMLLVYVAAQLAGVAAVAVLVAELAPTHLSARIVAPAPPFDERACLVEAFTNFMNVFVGLSAGLLGEYKAIIVASYVVVLIYTTGAALDPSATFLDCVLTHDYSVWTYPTAYGGIAGGILAGVCHRGAVVALEKAGVLRKKAPPAAKKPKQKAGKKGKKAD